MHGGGAVYHHLTNERSHLCCRAKRVFANAHAYHISSISPNTFVVSLALWDVEEALRVP